jgi:hypothetical protein
MLQGIIDFIVDCNIILCILCNTFQNYDLSKIQKILEYNKYDIVHHNIRFRCLHVKITVIFSGKQDLAFHQMSSYIQRIAMMHRRERKTNIHTARKKSHASSINHTTKTKSKCRCSIPPSHATRSFFFFRVVGYHALRKAGEKKKRRSLSWGNAASEVAGDVRTRFRSHKMLLRAHGRSN